MPKTIALVGHCGPDASYLRLAVSRAVKDAKVVFVDDQHELNTLIAGGAVDLVMLNRQLDYGFETDEGVELIRRLRAKHPTLRAMLVSNYPDAQQAAVEAGAVRGFGKREIGSAKVSDLIRDALNDAERRPLTEAS